MPCPPNILFSRTDPMGWKSSAIEAASMVSPAGALPVQTVSASGLVSQNIGNANIVVSGTEAITIAKADFTAAGNFGGNLTQKWVVQGADSFSLGEPVKLVAFPGDHTAFEDPPVDEGRRLRANGEAEVGVGLAQALGIGVGSTLAVQLPSGTEVRFRVVGTVRALDDNGRIAYVRPARLLAADPGTGGQIVVKLAPGADRAAVSARLSRLGAQPSAVGGATTRNGAFLGTLAALLRAVAIIDALVCLYALVQALGLVARERRPTLALLRATGADTPTVGAVLAGAALAVALPAAVLALALERLVLAPLVGRLAAGYADLTARSSTAQVAIAVLGLGALSAIAAAWLARRATAEPPVLGLREE